MTKVLALGRDTPLDQRSFAELHTDHLVWTAKFDDDLDASVVSVLGLAAPFAGDNCHCQRI